MSIEQGIENQAVDAAHKADLLSATPISFEEYEATVRKYILMEDRGILKLLIAHYLTNFMPQKAVWMMLIAPSGGGKTEFLNGLLYLPMVAELSLLTPNTFLSGMPGENDASLLPKINGHYVIMKDLTTLMSMQRDAKAEVFSQFREIWDGGMVKTFGNGKVRKWKGKITLLVATTEAVDINQQQMTHLGERFLNYRVKMPPRIDAGLKALDNMIEQPNSDMVWQIQKATFRFFMGLDPEAVKKPVPLPREIRSKIVHLADFATNARSGVIRETGNKHDVTFVPSAEMPTRLSQQLYLLACGLALANGKEGYREEDMDTIFKIALDSIPQTNRMVILEMARSDERTTAEIAVALGYPTAPIKLYLENLALLRICTRIKGSDSEQGGNADRWTLKPNFTEIVRKYEKISPMTDEEIAALPPPNDGWGDFSDVVKS